MESFPPRRVLFLVRPAAGGIRQHLLNLLAGLDRCRFTPSLAAPADFLRALPETSDLATFPLALAARFSLLADLRVAKQFAKLTAQADLVHVHGLRAGWVAALAAYYRPFPLIVSAHNLVPAGRATRLALRLIGHRAARIIAISEAIADGLAAQGDPRHKIVVIPNGIDVNFFAQGPDRAEARQALSVPNDAFMVGCIARLSPEKGVDVLVCAAAALPGMLFLIAGDGPEHEKLARDLPSNVRLLGRIADTRVLLRAADVLAVPSRQEGQGIVALEAMASGIPVVASHVGGLAEMLTDGETALLVPPDDPSALADALIRLQNDAPLWHRLITNAETLVREKYESSQMVRATEEVYDKVAEPAH